MGLVAVLWFAKYQLELLLRILFMISLTEFHSGQLHPRFPSHFTVVLSASIQTETLWLGAETRRYVHRQENGLMGKERLLCVREQVVSSLLHQCLRHHSGVIYSGVIYITVV